LPVRQGYFLAYRTEHFLKLKSVSVDHWQEMGMIIEMIKIQRVEKFSVDH
jgi:hypothetical protein